MRTWRQHPTPLTREAPTPSGGATCVPSGPNSVSTTPAAPRSTGPRSAPSPEPRCTGCSGRCRHRTSQCSTLEHRAGTLARPSALDRFHGQLLLRKEVIQPHLPVRLPCYDFVPIADPTFDSSLPQGVGPPASGVTDFRDVTGGVYKARERIHRSVADLRLLATPTSWGRVADPNPN
jgi:hypothetical protein